MGRAYLAPDRFTAGMAAGFWAVLGLGVLLKGPIAPMVPLLAGLTLAIMDRPKGARFWRLSTPWLPALRAGWGLPLMCSSPRPGSWPSASRRKGASSRKRSAATCSTRWGRGRRRIGARPGCMPRSSASPPSPPPGSCCAPCPAPGRSGCRRRALPARLGGADLAAVRGGADQAAALRPAGLPGADDARRALGDGPAAPRTAALGPLAGNVALAGVAVGLPLAFLVAVYVVDTASSRWRWPGSSPGSRWRC